MTTASYWWFWAISKQHIASNGVILLSEARQQVNKGHIGSVMGLLQTQSYLGKTMLLHSFFLYTLLWEHKTLCTVNMNNCKANMSCNHALRIFFLHESQSTFQRKINTAISIWSGGLLFHRCSYHTTQSPQTAVMLPWCRFSYKENQASDAFGPTGTGEVNTWLGAFYFEVCISRGHMKVREDLSHRCTSPNTCIFFWVYII